MWNRGSGRKMGWWAAQHYSPWAGWMWLLLALPVSLAAVGVAWHGARLGQDLEGAESRQGAGTVTAVVYEEPAPDSGDLHGRRLAAIAVDGQHFTPNLLEPAGPPLREGDRVTFRYRVGYSGKRYLDQLSPLTAEK